MMADQEWTSRKLFLSSLNCLCNAFSFRNKFWVEWYKFKIEKLSISDYHWSKNFKILQNKTSTIVWYKVLHLNLECGFTWGFLRHIHCEPYCPRCACTWTLNIISICSYFILPCTFYKFNSLWIYVQTLFCDTKLCFFFTIQFCVPITYWCNNHKEFIK